LIETKKKTRYWAASAGAVLSCVAPIAMFGVSAMNPYGLQIATCGTLLVLPLLGFARRYLHGEFMFSRFSMLSVAMGFGFNLVALAPTLEHALAGWSLFGFASTFLIGAYNDRPTVRNNATYAFAAYQVRRAEGTFFLGV
jgi:NADH:ubiquinone oxidoreductase subunit 5 (subunit L)/multisubunit Na+/H+ antiporter MnhA subunit